MSNSQQWHWAMVKARAIVMSCRLSMTRDISSGVQNSGLVVTGGHIFSSALTSATDFSKWRQILMDMATEKDARWDTEPEWLGQFKQILHGIQVPKVGNEQPEPKDPGPQQILLALEMLARNKKLAQPIPTELLLQLHFSVDQARKLMEQVAVTQDRKEDFRVNMIIASVRGACFVSSIRDR